MAAPTAAIEGRGSHIDHGSDPTVLQLPSASETAAAFQFRSHPALYARPDEEPICRIGRKESKDHTDLHHEPEHGTIRSRVRRKQHILRDRHPTEHSHLEGNERECVCLHGVQDRFARRDVPRRSRSRNGSPTKRSASSKAARLSWSARRPPLAAPWHGRTRGRSVENKGL